MQRQFIYIIVLLLIGTFCLVIEAQSVRNLRVEDNPFDDGSGLVVKFEPLNEANIIEYRIYRGLSRDSLFYIGSLEVDPKIGISSNEVSFFDKDYRTFVDIDSPRRVKQEKGQKKGSPIFRALPRDLSVIGPMFKEYSTLALIDKKQFYKTTEKYIRETDGEKELFGALKIVHIDAILANVQPGKKYWYSVIAVDQRRNFLPAADPVPGIAIDNKPLPVDKFYAVLLEDINEIKFEFEPPIYSDDIAQYQVNIMKRSDISAYEEYIN